VLATVTAATEIRTIGVPHAGPTVDH